MVAPAAEPAAARVGLVRLAGLLLLPPIAWGVHTGVVYLLVTIECAGDWRGSTAAVFIVTAVFAAAAASSGVRAWRKWRREGGPTRDPREARPFVYTLTVAGSILFTLAILLAGSTPLFAPPCVSGTIDPPLTVVGSPAAIRS